MPTAPASAMQRFVFRATELRTENVNGKRSVYGYAGVYNAETTIGRSPWGFREIIRPGAFAGVVNADVRCCFNHDPNILLGRSKSGTMKMEHRDKGLWFNIPELPDTDQAAAVAASIQRGDVDGCSFSFRALKERWTWAAAKDEMDFRELLELEVPEFGPVTFPAYDATEVDCRSMLDVRDEARKAAADAANQTARLRLDLESLA